MNIGELVRFRSNTSQSAVEIGIIISSVPHHQMSDVLWEDGITTCDWEDLEVINESSIV